MDRLEISFTRRSPLGYTVKDTVLKTAGGLVGVLGLFLLVLGVAMYIDPEPAGRQTAVAIGVLSLIFLVPGGLMYRAGRRAARRERSVEEIAQLARTWRRVKIDRLSVETGLSTREVYSLLAEAQARGLVSGHLDRGTGEFFTEESMEEQLKVRFCMFCGAPLEGSYLRGETVVCPSCGSVIS